MVLVLKKAERILRRPQLEPLVLQCAKRHCWFASMERWVVGQFEKFALDKFKYL
jgi:hypothetical protein